MDSKALKRRSNNPIHPYRKPPADERRMKEWIMNTSWSFTPNGGILVGCDGELSVNQGGTTEISYPSLSENDRGGFFIPSRTDSARPNGMD